MTSTYGSAKICPFDNQNCDLATEGLPLEPSIEAILADTPNRSWDELKYVWEQWRVVSGRKMRDTFKEYIDISNEAAIYNSTI
jgi:peptidyl-dipeptidase A